MISLVQKCVIKGVEMDGKCQFVGDSNVDFAPKQAVSDLGCKELNLHLARL